MISLIRPLPLCARAARTRPVVHKLAPYVGVTVARSSIVPAAIPSRTLGDLIRRDAWKRPYTTTSLPPQPIQPKTAPARPKTAQPPRPKSASRRARRLLAYLAAFLAITYASYEFIPPARHLLVAAIRCTRLLRAVILNVVDYRWMFAKHYDESKFTPEEIKEFRRADRRECHRRSSARLFEALKRNAGIYVKLGQHISSIQALPKE
jgi:aarF domain-containing kinase